MKQTACELRAGQGRDALGTVMHALPARLQPPLSPALLLALLPRLPPLQELGDGSPARAGSVELL